MGHAHRLCTCLNDGPAARPPDRCAHQGRLRADLHRSRQRRPWRSRWDGRRAVAPTRRRYAHGLEIGSAGTVSAPVGRVHSATGKARHSVRESHGRHRHRLVCRALLLPRHGGDGRDGARPRSRADIGRSNCGKGARSTGRAARQVDVPAAQSRQAVARGSGNDWGRSSEHAGRCSINALPISRQVLIGCSQALSASERDRGISAEVRKQLASTALDWVR